MRCHPDARTSLYDTIQIHSVEKSATLENTDERAYTYAKQLYDSTNIVLNDTLTH